MRSLLTGSYLISCVRLRFAASPARTRGGSVKLQTETEPPYGSWHVALPLCSPTIARTQEARWTCPQGHYEHRSATRREPRRQRRARTRTMSMRKRLSVSSTRSESPLVFATAPNADSEEWVAAWKAVLAKGTSWSSYSQGLSVQA